MRIYVIANMHKHPSPLPVLYMLHWDVLHWDELTDTTMHVSRCYMYTCTHVCRYEPVYVSVLRTCVPSSFGRQHNGDPTGKCRCANIVGGESSSAQGMARLEAAEQTLRTEVSEGSFAGEKERVLHESSLLSGLMQAMATDGLTNEFFWQWH